MKALRFGSVVLLTLTGATVAQAHMPYVLPTLFDLGKGDHVTVQSAFAEDAFLPEVAMRDAPFHLVGPDGAQLPTGPVTHLRDLSVFEAAVPADGTYRITSGQRAGRKGKMFKVGSEWKMRGEGGEPPANAEQVDVQSMTLADAYVTRGQPSNAALKPLGKGLEIQPITHPNGIVAGSGAGFALLFDGKPLANADITLFRSAGLYDGRKVVAQVKSDADGRFSLKPDDAGTYLILVRHRGAAPAGSETPYRSYTYTLTFDAA
ncbi:Nickel transport complex protein, NikM subunit, transmembrane [Sphingobium chlorophenolicum L-1]|uniref:Nickel transport complex protein, NikM subunit, transmembrane n=1 Tax=Sphingobium chlorophenolicum L-1 TaxID=690566 RepID=F6EXF9_SPHCR|nr:DUF4198 domain-containing protein [Sphingobium chlorophenolicum]AEG48206.1 Nickel transport complex protein, NikM subunit, transmembrane [Sphingobium chlorophenolicum L-1]